MGKFDLADREIPFLTGGVRKRGIDTEMGEQGCAATNQRLVAEQRAVDICKGKIAEEDCEQIFPVEVT